MVHLTNESPASDVAAEIREWRWEGEEATLSLCVQGNVSVCCEKRSFANKPGMFGQRLVTVCPAVTHPVLSPIRTLT